MTRPHAIAPVTDRSRDAARRPFGLRRRQRAASAVASVIVSCVLLSMVGLGMTDMADLPVQVAGGAAARVSAA